MSATSSGCRASSRSRRRASRSSSGCAGARPRVRRGGPAGRGRRHRCPPRGACDRGRARRRGAADPGAGTHERPRIPLGTDAEAALDEPRSWEARSWMSRWTASSIRFAWSASLADGSHRPIQWKDRPSARTDRPTWPPDRRSSRWGSAWWWHFQRWVAWRTETDIGCPASSRDNRSADYSSGRLLHVTIRTCRMSDGQHWRTSGGWDVGWFSSDDIAAGGQPERASFGVGPFVAAGWVRRCR